MYRTHEVLQGQRRRTQCAGLQCIFKCRFRRDRSLNIACAPCQCPDDHLSGGKVYQSVSVGANNSPPIQSAFTGLQVNTRARTTNPLCLHLLDRLSSFSLLLYSFLCSLLRCTTSFLSAREIDSPKQPSLSLGSRLQLITPPPLSLPHTRVIYISCEIVYY
ncbi:unnamed protein product [Dibothriocephalus latus]|uniref:Uncharacterized protein n=1 Tax=Dibothriocephalus latus TaxID=60516 RepID=A0A3P7QRL9_DIBLA|nr:unnamed protein product [Dibothriocephalus latus]